MGDLEAAWQKLMGFLGGGSGGSASSSGAFPGNVSPASNPFGTTPGAGGGAGGLNLQSLLSLITSLGGSYYGINELQQMQRVYDAQRQNAALAMNQNALARRTVSATLPLNKQLEYATEAPVNAMLAQRGLTQAPGAQASAQTSALAPFEQQNIGLGANLATFGFPYVEHQGTPDYLSVLSQLNQFGKGSTFSAPSGTPGVGP